MPITITDKQINDTGDYVVITLSNDEQVAIATCWADQIDEETGKSLLELEIANAPIRAQARIDDAVSTTAAAQAILDKF